MATDPQAPVTSTMSNSDAPSETTPLEESPKATTLEESPEITTLVESSTALATDNNIPTDDSTSGHSSETAFTSDSITTVGTIDDTVMSSSSALGGALGGVVGVCVVLFIVMAVIVVVVVVMVRNKKFQRHRGVARDHNPDMGIENAIYGAGKSTPSIYNYSI